jgi:uncharacterized protein YjgD (DUF1641 family)
MSSAPGIGAELERIGQAAQDALTDETVARLAAALSDALGLIDQINRAELARAIPALARMVNNGDLERLVALARVYASAEDALTDEMVGRLTDTVGHGLSLLDRVNRSGIEKALPVLSRMVADGDLERLAQLARVYSSAEDALSDEMVGRIAETVVESLSLMDRLSRGGAVHLVEMLERMQASGALERVANILPKLLDRLDHIDRMLIGLEAAASEAQKYPAPKGGIGGLWQLAREPETQQSLQFLIAFAKQLRSSYRS